MSLLPQYDFDPVTGLPIPKVNPSMGFPSPQPMTQPSLGNKFMSVLGGPEGLMQLGAGLLSASGPSEQRISLGQALGSGLVQNQAFKQQQQENQLKQLLLMSQIQRNKAKQQGGAAPSKVQEYEYAKQNGFKGSFEEWMRVASSQPQSPAGIQEYEYWNKLSPEEKKNFLALQRSPVVPQLSIINGVPTLVDRTNATQTPLTTQEAEIEAARKKAEAQASAKAGGAITGARVANAPTAYAAYQASVKNLESAMSDTATGPVAGRLPALTAAQQTAEGAQATMAPILKQLFRNAGEGTFTDQDQALLMKMVPTRQDHPEARKAKLGMIDEVVRAKLGIGGAPAAAAGGPAVGAVEDGYRFKGGDPSKPENWERAQ